MAISYRLHLDTCFFSPVPDAQSSQAMAGCVSLVWFLSGMHTLSIPFSVLVQVVPCFTLLLLCSKVLDLEIHGKEHCGRRAGTGAVAKSLHLIHQHEAEQELIGNDISF